MSSPVPAAASTSRADDIGLFNVYPGLSFVLRAFFFTTGLRTAPLVYWHQMKWHMHVYKGAGSTWGGNKAVWVTLCMTFSERELIPSYNRLWGRYGKLLHRYLGCLGDHQSTGAGGDAIKRGMCVCESARARARACVREKERDEKCSFVTSVTHTHCIQDVRLCCRSAAELDGSLLRRRSVGAARKEKAALVFGFI